MQKTLITIKETFQTKTLDLTKIQELVEIFLLSTISFAVPFFIGHPQLVVGILVNAALIRSAFSLDGKKLLTMILFPSLGVLARGLIFGPFTVFLMYFIPFIWLSNSILVFSMKYLMIKKEINYSISLFLSSLVKTLSLFIPAFILVKSQTVPNLFLQSMGIIQFITAVGGGVLIALFNSFGSKFLKTKND